tara:strand:+ start:293 stop:577 length:285 start_codon:yes stop_codon:yes gene_type:complete
MNISEVKSNIIDRCKDISYEKYTMRIIDESIRFMLLNDCSLIKYIGSPHIFEQLSKIVRTRIEYERKLAEDRLFKVRVLNQWLEDYDIIEKLKS